jgi:hypothetical protein
MGNNDGFYLTLWAAAILLGAGWLLYGPEGKARATR